MAKKGKQIKFIFYEVIMPATSRLRFEKILELIDKMKLKDRNRLIDGDYIRLDTFSKDEDYKLYEGEMIQLDLEYLGSKAKLDEHPTDINMEDDEGISHETAFLYDSNFEILILQSSRPGVSPSKIESYFRNTGKIDGNIQINPILRPDAYKRMIEMELISKFEMKIAGIDQFKNVLNDQLSDKEVNRIMNKFEAPWIDVILSVGRQKKLKLKKSEVIHFAEELLRIWKKKPKDVTKIKITGVSKEFEKQMVDLIADVMYEDYEVIPNEKRRIPYTDRKPLARIAWEKNQSEISKIKGTKVEEDKK